MFALGRAVQEAPEAPPEAKEPEDLSQLLAQTLKSMREAGDVEEAEEGHAKTGGRDANA